MWFRLTKNADGSTSLFLDQYLVNFLFFFIHGFYISGFLFGMYLWLSFLNGWHTTEAFGSIRVKEYKSFVRFTLDRNEDLKIQPVWLHPKYKPGWSQIVKDQYPSTCISPSQMRCA